MPEEELDPKLKEEFLKAGEIILDLLTSQKNEMQKALEESKDERLDSMEKSKSLIEKHIQEKAFLISRQKETMAKNIKSLIGGELGEIVKKIDKKIGIKAFLSSNAKERIEHLKKIEMSIDDFQKIQGQIESSIGTKVLAAERMKTSAKKLSASKEERLQRMKEASEVLEKSGAIASKAISIEKQRGHVTSLGSKEERQQRIKEAAEKLESDQTLKDKIAKIEKLKEDKS
ncbi:MAG: hypothetical protein ACTSVI_06190 [Promethearchaeota archaeon]